MKSTQSSIVVAGAVIEPLKAKLGVQLFAVVEVGVGGGASGHR